MYSNQSSVTHDVRLDVPPVAGSSGRRGPYDTTGKPKPKPPPKLRTEDSRAKQERLRPYSAVDPAPGLTSFEDEDEDEDKSEDSYLQCLDEDFLDEEVEAEAEAMVNALLKQYTTLFSS